jgi:hypothetical protein
MLKKDGDFDLNLSQINTVYNHILYSLTSPLILCSHLCLILPSDLFILRFFNETKVKLRHLYSVVEHPFLKQKKQNLLWHRLINALKLNSPVRAINDYQHPKQMSTRFRNLTEFPPVLHVKAATGMIRSFSNQTLHKLCQKPEDWH